MSVRKRQITIILATVLFATFATQAILFAHLLLEGHQHHQEHDSHHCSLCQQLLSLSHSTMIEKQTVISQHLICEQSSIFHIEVAPAISSVRISNPRAPPAYL
jgi:hypothetical protein